MTTKWVWRKSSRSATQGDCVEVGTSGETSVIAVRDSKLGDDGLMLRFPRTGIAALIQRVKSSA